MQVLEANCRECGARVRAKDYGSMMEKQRSHGCNSLHFDLEIIDIRP